MEGSIQILPPEVVNRIAAGEVVERPSSVLKELLENALDAGASSIRVRAGEGGIGYIEVEDDGDGMIPEEVRMSVRRHATSKIRNFEDLYALRTFGFRGEALSSIASVSRMEIRSCKKGSLEGVRMVVEGGRLREFQPWGCPLGTTVRVEDLFFNVPARRKFLRSSRTESQHLRETMAKIALLHWRVGFHYEYEGREVFSLPPALDWESRAARIFGEEDFEHLYSVHASDGEIEVQGLLPHPNRHRRGAGGLWFFVNGRWVQDRGLLHAVLRGYGSLLERGRYPLGAVLLRLPPDEVDVNVHPTKKEVRFRSPRRVYPLVTAAVRHLLKEQPWVTEAIRDTETQQGELRISEPSRPFSPAGFPSEETPGGKTLPLIPHQVQRASEITFLGQVGETYLIFQAPEGLLILDQHAAHERILFHRLRTQWTSRERIRGQEVLFPEVVEIPSELGQILEGLVERLSRLGWRIEPFGGETWRIRSLPSWMDPSKASEVLLDIVEACAGIVVEGQEETLIMERVLSRLACHGAVRAGQRMDSGEAMDLLRQLKETPERGLCPHGRPTLVEIPLKELHRRFGRT